MMQQQGLPQQRPYPQGPGPEQGAPGGGQGSRKPEGAPSTSMGPMSSSGMPIRFVLFPGMGTFLFFDRSTAPYVRTEWPRRVWSATISAIGSSEVNGRTLHVVTAPLGSTDGTGVRSTEVHEDGI